MVEQNPFQIEMPESRSIGQLKDSIQSLIDHIAWELGELYDAKLRVHQEDWLGILRAARGENLVLHDPSFVFGEPEMHWSSPVSEALPEKSAAVRDRFFRARKTRNAWTHTAVEQDWGRYKQGVQRYKELLNSVGLQLGEGWTNLTQRIVHLQNGPVQPPQSEAEKRAELEALLQQERERNQALLQEQRAALQKAQQVGANAKQLEADNARLSALIAANHQELAALTDELRALRRDDRLALPEPSDALSLASHGSALWGPESSASRATSVTSTIPKL